MSLLYLAGPRFNLIENANSITPSPAEDALFPAADIGDGDPGTGFKFGSLTAAPSIVFDLDLLGGTGGFENWTGTTPDGWTEQNSGAGHVDEVVGGPATHEGAKAAEFDNDDGGAAESSLVKDVVVRPGQALTISSALYDSSAGFGAITLAIRNQDTGSYLTTAGAWQAGTTVVHPTFVTTGGAYDTFSTNFTVEPYSTIGKSTTTLRLQLRNASTTVSYADAVYLTPSLTFASIHGHNIDPRCGLVLQSSPDNSAWTTRATFTVRKYSFYVTLGTQTFRYWKLLFSETNSSTSGPIFIGEAVLGEYATLGTGVAYPFGLTYTDPQIRVPKRVGPPTSYQLSQFNQRSMSMTFKAENKTRQEEILALMELSRGGHPIVVVPHNGNSFADVIYGKLAGEMPHSWETPTFVPITTSLEEMAFPLVTG